MKKTTALRIACLILWTFASAFAESDFLMPAIVELENGSVQIYNLGGNKPPAYISGDGLGDVCYAVESAGGIVLIESTAFVANNAAWKAYIDGLGKDIAGMLMAYHPNGCAVYSSELPFATENALANWGEGGSIRALTGGFVESYGGEVAAKLPAEARMVDTGDTVAIAGLDFIIRDEGDGAHGIEIPAIHCVYIHMLGSATHNILTSTEHIDAFIAELENFGYDLVLTGRNAPQGREAVKTKIARLATARELAESNVDAAFLSAL